jgi:RNA polymerase sigma factor (sigma-70 family)
VPTTSPYPFQEKEDTDREDLALLGRIRDGNREALEKLVTRHQAWIYNLILRMVYLPQDAEDATQEVLVKMVTKLSSFQGKSQFRTWLYRIAINHVLNMRRTRAEAAGWTFERYGEALTNAPDLELPDPQSIPADVQLLVDEARIGCSSGMLLCLDREQRLVYILGEIFGVSAKIGAELLEITPENFRQKLSRARRDLHQFMHHQCGLVNAANPCRCAKKTQAFIQAGYVDPRNLLFARAHLARVREVAPSVPEDINELDAAYAAIHREHPFQPSPDFVGALRELMNQPTFQSILGPRQA